MYIEKLNDFLSSDDFKLHPMAYFDLDEVAHDSVEQRKERQRKTRALNRLYSEATQIWESQLGLIPTINSLISLEKSIFTTQGLKTYYKQCGELSKMLTNHFKLVKRLAKDPVLKEYYKEFMKFEVNYFEELLTSTYDYIDTMVHIRHKKYIDNYSDKGFKYDHYTDIQIAIDAFKNKE